jgi:GDPmannose 4,6-dehydratase
LSKRAIICGISGQDGTYLAKLLLDKGYDVWGTSRDAEMTSFPNLQRLSIKQDIRLSSLNLRDVGGIISLIGRVRPDEIYNLAAQSSVGLSFDQPFETIESIVFGGLNLLEAIRVSGHTTRLYNAGSTECFGDTGLTPANESSQFNPCSPYAVAKSAAHWTVANYRQSYGMFACTGILSNHDSPLRPKRFVTRKIIRAVAETASGSQTRLSLGNLNIERDWGWAPDYVDAIWRILQSEVPEDFIIATGITSTLQDFIATAYKYTGRDWREFVSIDPGLLRPADIIHSRVSPAKAAERLGWRATYGMTDVVRMMIEDELRLLSAEASASWPSSRV